MKPRLGESIMAYMPKQRMALCLLLYTQSMKYKIPPVFVSKANSSQDDISQLILLKRDLPLINLIIYGGHAAPLVSPHIQKSLL